MEVYEIHEFLNWLSEQLNRDPAYRESDKSTNEYPEYEFIRSSNGFRLPTSDEYQWLLLSEYSNAMFWWCSERYLEERVESSDTNKLLRHLSRYQSNHYSGLPNLYEYDISDERSVMLVCKVNDTLPNRFGVYELGGGVQEVCNDARRGGLTAVLTGDIFKDYNSSKFAKCVSTSSRVLSIADSVGFRIAVPYPSDKNPSPK